MVFFKSKLFLEERVMRKLFVLMAAVAFVVAFTLPAAAGEVSISGAAEMNLWFDSVSEEPYIVGDYDDDDLNFDQDTNSTLTFDFKNEAVGGKVEMRYGGGSGTVRHWYGTYKTGFGTLLFGQTGAPTDVVVEGPKRGGGAFRGRISSNRQPMIALWAGGLTVALLKPYIGESGLLTDTDTSLPQIEASYNFTAGPVGVTLFAGYNSYDEVSATDQSYSVDSMAYGGVVSFAAGPATIKAGVYAADNPIEGYHTTQDGADMYPAYFDAASNTVKDASVLGYAASVAYKVSDTLTFVGGYGYDCSEQDQATTYEDESSAYFIYAIFSLAKGVSIAPEFGMLDHMDRTEGTSVFEEGDETWYGAEFKIKF